MNINKKLSKIGRQDDESELWGPLKLPYLTYWQEEIKINLKSSIS